MPEQKQEMWEERFDQEFDMLDGHSGVHRCHGNGCNNKCALKPQLKAFIRAERRKAAEDAIKAVVLEEAPPQKLHPYDLDGPNDGWNDCRSEVIRKGEEYLKTL